MQTRQVYIHSRYISERLLRRRSRLQLQFARCHSIRRLHVDFYVKPLERDRSSLDIMQFYCSLSSNLFSRAISRKRVFFSAQLSARIYVYTCDVVHENRSERWHWKKKKKNNNMNTVCVTLLALSWADRGLRKGFETCSAVSVYYTILLQQWPLLRLSATLR